MIHQPPADRMLKPDHGQKPPSISVSTPARPPLVVVRKPATVRDVLGRDPQEKNFIAGNTGLIRTAS
jgi:hypothetical protein